MSCLARARSFIDRRPRLLLGWGLIALGVALSFTRPMAVRAQEVNARATARIVVLQPAANAASTELLAGFRKRLAELGRRADISVEYEADAPRAGGARSGASPDLVLALGTRATTRATTEFRSVPTIAALLARESALPEASAAAAVVLAFPVDVELEWIQRILPKVRRVGVLFSTDDNAKLVEQARESAKKRGLVIVARRVTNPSELPAALSALAASADAIWGIPDELVLTPETAKAVLLASLRSRVPFVGLSAQWVRAGAVYSLDRDYTDLGVQTADAAVRMLDGASGRSVGIVAPRTVRLSLNTRVADMMYLVVSPTLIASAAEIVR